jgi:phosphoglycolate phosphatase-like HAD superfamily hydrolase
MKDQTPANLFDGIKNIVQTYQDLPQVIISQNASDGIRGVLEDNNLAGYFNMIIGYEQVDIRKQKPEPDGFLICIEKLSLTNDFTIYYVGDHEADVLFVQKTKKVLESMQVSTQLVSIGAFYGNDQNISQWTLKPDYYVNNPYHIVEIVNSI